MHPLLEKLHHQGLVFPDDDWSALRFRSADQVRSAK